MDTNQVDTILREMASGHQSNQTTILIVGMVIAALAPTLAALASMFNSRSAKITTEDTKKIATEIHIAVNSERTAMTTLVQSLRDDILRLTGENATAKEKQQNQEVAIALATKPGTKE